MTKIKVAALQLAFGEDTGENIRNVSDLVREAHGKGAQVVLPPELFEGPYFCRTEDEGLFATAKPTEEHPSVLAMQALAAELGIWIPTSFFEADGPHHYNSLAMINPDGKVAGVYRKSHIPDGPGYEEKFYFRPGNTGFKVWPGPHMSTLGVGVCWDQWYPETARAMMLMGAEILFYPTAIGTEPHDPDLDTSRLWRRRPGRHCSPHGRSSPCATAVTCRGRDRAARCRWPSGRRGFRRPSASSRAPSRDTTGPSKCRRRAWCLRPATP